MTLQDRTEWDVLDDSGFVPISAYIGSVEQPQQVQPQQVQQQLNSTSSL
jgi:hypothetical protein